MDIDINCNITRERSVFSSTSSALYHEYMALNNNLLNIESPEPIDSSQLSYASQVDIDESIRKVTDNTFQ